jgi:hypothetical protein
MQFAYALLQAHCMYMIKLVGVGIRSIMMTAIYRRYLKLSQAALASPEMNAGKIINQVSGDANRFMNIMPAFMNLFAAPIQVCIITLNRNIKTSKYHP